jgi:thymidine kinase
MPTRDEIKQFSIMIEEMATAQKVGLMDAICHHCKETGLEVEVAATLISSALKAKIKEEAQELNLIKKSSKLPI